MIKIERRVNGASGLRLVPNWTFVFLGANLDAFAQGANLGVPMANAVRYDPANYRGVYASLAKSTNLFSANPAKAAVDFFKGEAAGIKKS